MAVNAELTSILHESQNRKTELRNFVPSSFGHKKLLKLAQIRHPFDISSQDQMMARYSPMAEWLTRTQTLKEFSERKRNIFNLVASDIFPDSEDKDYWNEIKGRDRESLNIFTNLSMELNIMPKSHIEHMQTRRNRSEQNWAELEVNRNMLVDRFLSNSHENLESLLDRLKQINSVGFVGRKGLVIGDFRARNT